MEERPSISSSAVRAYSSSTVRSSVALLVRMGIAASVRVGHGCQGTLGLKILPCGLRVCAPDDGKLEKLFLQLAWQLRATVGPAWCR